MIPITLTVNGSTHQLQVEPRWLLADVLREQLGLTGTHLGCEQGVCGACTVLLNDRPVRSCLTLAVSADAGNVVTVEGLAEGDTLHPVQEAFWQEHALQCGFCTPGFLITAAHFLKDHPHPTRAEIRDALSGNLCRCTGYQFIVNAVERAAKTLQEQESAG
ncbi:MAG: 4-hydroxybenzoyl-CoA reductase subunit gamma [Sulfobacillus acidophilus]|uniref:4-hydroxybenzoyl-CoA reductase subunit gamma n=1 Tax=Sulfobacillus acidophilus TaxID=53633 RepID=A0A2T2WE33_9FIRM|nr:MAG: 4-hydroxybenzoyl-CoA reductase subunit gamma [Sulfobacillus acidophilus]